MGSGHVEIKKSCCNELRMKCFLLINSCSNELSMNFFLLINMSRIINV